MVRRTSAFVALGYITWHVNQEVTRRSKNRWVLPHAAGVVRDGLGIAMPAPMESGRTTTTAALMRAGYGYLTDKAVAIHPDSLLIAPFPKPLCLEPGSWPLFPELAQEPLDNDPRKWHVHPGAFGEDAVAKPTRLAAVVMPHYAPTKPSGLTPLNPGQAVITLALSTFAFHEHPSRNLAVLARIARELPVFTLTISDLASAVSAVDRVVEVAREGRDD